MTKLEKKLSREKMPVSQFQNCCNQSTVNNTQRYPPIGEETEEETNPKVGSDKPKPPKTIEVINTSNIEAPLLQFVIEYKEARKKSKLRISRKSQKKIDLFQTQNS